MTITLAQIDALFSSMNDDEQLLLIDHLVDRMRAGDGDELLEGMQRIAGAIADGDYLLADSIFPQGAPLPPIWKAHAAKRDATLEGAIRLRALGNGRRAA